MKTALLLLAAITCEGQWTPGCDILTYNKYTAAHCILKGDDGLCRTSEVTPWGVNEGNRRANALPDCPDGLGFLDLMNYAKSVHPCKVSTEKMKLIPLGMYAD